MESDCQLGDADEQPEARSPVLRKSKLPIAPAKAVVFVAGGVEFDSSVTNPNNIAIESRNREYKRIREIGQCLLF